MDEDRVLAALLGMEDRIGIRLAKLESSLERVEGRLERVEGRLERLEGRFERLESRVERLEQGLEDLKTSVAALQSRVSDIESSAAKTEATVKELRLIMMAKFERIENRLTQISEDMQVTMGAASTAIQQREGDRRDLAVFVDMVSVMQRKMSRLQTDVEELQRKAS